MQKKQNPIVSHRFGMRDESESLGEVDGCVVGVVVISIDGFSRRADAGGALRVPRFSVFIVVFNR